MATDSEAIGILAVAEQSSTIDRSGRRTDAVANTCVHIGTELATGRDGRLVLQLRADPETDSEAAKIHLGPNSSLVLKRDRDRARVLELIDGWLQFFSGRPAKIDVDARYITAGVRGTDFTLFTQKNDCDVYAPVSGRGCSALWVQSGSVSAREPERPYDDPSAITVSVVDGRPAFNGEASLTDNGVIAYAGQPPRRARLELTPENAVDWVVYYPPLVQFAEETCGTTYLQFDADRPQESVRCATAPAFAAIVDGIKIKPGAFSPGTRNQAAVRLMSQSDIGRARDLLTNAADAEGLALRSLIALKTNERSTEATPGDHSVARDFAERAIAADPKSVNAQLALSYVEQAEFNISDAQAAANEAVRLSSAFGATSLVLTKARQAELALSQQDTSRALKAANDAVCIASGTECPNRNGASSSPDRARPDQALSGGPILSRAYSVQGFAYLVALDADAAENSFNRSIAADGFSPLARLGLGLALIRKGRLDDGINQLELAVALDPEVSLYRSYLGKGYFEQNDYARAEKQFTLAKKIDGNDPTPWLYSALLRYAENDPAAALWAIEQSKELNDRRAVYRSRLLLDSDEAVRGASLGRTYKELGFEELARLEATKSLQVDPGNYSAHRLLTDANASFRRFEIARVSDLLQARLRAPKAQHPVNAQTAETRINTIGIDALTPAFNEYTQAFEQEGMKLTASASTGGNNTFEEELLFSWSRGPVSVAVTQYHFDTDGFRERHYQDQDYWNLLLQARVTPSSSVQFEFRDVNFDHGELYWMFDPTDFYDDDIVDDTQSWRIGGHHVFSNAWDMIGYFRHENAEAAISSRLADYFEYADESGDQAELQAIGRFDQSNVVLGYSRLDRDRTDGIDNLFSAYAQVLDSNMRHDHAYAYLYLNQPLMSQPNNGLVGADLSLTLGLSYTDYQLDLAGEEFGPGTTPGVFESSLERSRFLPKLGAVWALPVQGGVRTTLRAAYFHTVKRALIGDETLEPTSIAGFNQFYDDPEATKSIVGGIGLDFAGSGSDWYAGIQWTKRDLNFARIDTSASPFSISTTEAAESIASIYANTILWKKLAVGVNYEREIFDRSVLDPGVERIIDSKAHRVAFNARYFVNEDLTLAVAPAWVKQRGTFVDLSRTAYPGNDEFWIVNASASFKLPGRRGELAIAVENLFDESFNHQDTVPYDSRFAPERRISARATLRF